ncbi:MAG: chromate efflux transporter [Pseudomonadota bacterium]
MRRAAGAMAGAMAKAAVERVSFAQACRVWLKIGLLGFGGPAGQIALMHRLLVEEKRWLSESRFLHALNYCMMLPGPEAQQLATYVGWLLHRAPGGLVAGVAFVLPGALVILALSMLYAGFRELTVVGALFYGIKAAVLAVVIEAVLRIGKRALGNRAKAALAGAAFIAIFFFAVPFPLIVLAAALIGFCGGRLAPALFAPGAGHGARQPASADDPSDGAVHARPSWRRALRVAGLCLGLWFGPILALAATLGRDNVYVVAGLFFSKMAVVTFGGAYAVLAYVAQAAVETHGWLAPGEMLDGLGLAETTPGPLILVVQFVGFLAAYRNPGALDPMLAGVFGALLTLWVTFVPSFLWIFLGAPSIEALRGRQALSAALSGITAAVVGVIVNLALWFGLHVVFAEVAEVRVLTLRLLLPEWRTLDPAALVLTLAALVAMLRLKWGMLATLALTAALGMAYFYAVR